MKNKGLEIALNGTTAVNKDLADVSSTLTNANKDLTSANTRVTSDIVRGHGELADKTDTMWDSLELLMLAYIDDHHGEEWMAKADEKGFQC